MTHDERESPVTVALAGNPNSGKTTVFNAITGARQHVANYPGVTVEIREGSAEADGRRLRVVDLPGTYSLTAYSEEELVARDYIITRKPDVVVDVVDASNLERSLYLAVQLVELGAPVVVALNMMDIAEKRGLHIDFDRLSALTGVRFVPTVAHKSRGIDSLLETVVELAESPRVLRGDIVNYGPDVNREIDKLTSALADCRDLFADEPLRWLAIKLLEGDQRVVSFVRSKLPDARLLDEVEKSAGRIRALTGGDAETVLADRRYGFISGACQESVITDVETRHILSDKLDLVLTHRVLGLPVLLGLMYLVFYLTFSLGNYPAEGIDAGRTALAQWLRGVLPIWGIGALNLRSLLIDGVLGGVGSVVVFLPNLLVLFLAIAALEDSGYMARAAFVMDHLMHKMGLHGKSFIPMLLGFGCSVPAIMATRIIENRRDRLTTILIIPLMSCGAKIPIYALVIPAFFAPAWQGPMLWLVYILGVLLAVLLARLLKNTILAGESHPLVMELPPYRMPTLRGLLIHTWGRGWHFLKKAGTIILAGAVVMWFLANWPAPREEAVEAAASPAGARRVALESSAMARIGKGMEPALEAIGFDWRVGTAFISAAAAKELFVAQMGIVYGVAETDAGSKRLRDHLREDYSPLSGFVLLVFTLVASPCLATVAVVKRETGSWGWAALQWTGLTLLAYFVSLLIYQAGSLLGIGV